MADCSTMDDAVCFRCILHGKQLPEQYSHDRSDPFCRILRSLPVISSHKLRSLAASRAFVSLASGGPPAPTTACDACVGRNSTRWAAGAGSDAQSSSWPMLSSAHRAMTPASAQLAAPIRWRGARAAAQAHDMEPAGQRWHCWAAVTDGGSLGARRHASLSAGARMCWFASAAGTTLC